MYCELNGAVVDVTRSGAPDEVEPAKPASKESGCAAGAQIAYKVVSVVGVNDPLIGVPLGVVDQPVRV